MMTMVFPSPSYFFLFVLCVVMCLGEQKMWHVFGVGGFEEKMTPISVPVRS